MLKKPDGCKPAGFKTRADPIAATTSLPLGSATRSFPRQLRLLHATDFDHVFRTGQRSADGYFTILYRSTEGVQPRLGFALSKKRVRLAVGRNRLRRLVRESFRLRAPQLPPLDVVVLARDAAGPAVNREIFASLDRHWTRLELARLQSKSRADAPHQGALPPTTTT